MGDNVTDIAQARFQRNQRLLQRQLALAGQQAGAAFLAHLEAVARGASQEVVNRRWQAVEERSAAYQELLGAGDGPLQPALEEEILEQIDGEFEADWLEVLGDESGQALRAGLGEAGVRVACQLAYRRGYAAGMLNATRRFAREEDE